MLELLEIFDANSMAKIARNDDRIDKGEALNTNVHLF
jgi:hypothetical protein